MDSAGTGSAIHFGGGSSVDHDCALGTASVTFQALPTDVGAVLAEARSGLDGVITRRLGPGAYHLDLAGRATVLLTVAPAARAREHLADSHVLTVTVADRGDLTDTELDRVFAAVTGMPFTRTEVDAFVRQLPLTTGLTERIADKPLHDTGLVITGHFLTDLVVQVETLVALGARPEAITVLRKEYPYRYRNRVAAHLRRMGVTIAAVDSAADALAAHAGRVPGPSLVIDDGAYVLPALLGAPRLLPTFAAVVEQTMSGIVRLEPFGDDLPLLVFSVAQSAMNGAIESYWVADSAVRSVLGLLTDEKVEGRAALVIGFGNVGARIAEILRDRRMRVAVYDEDILRLLGAHEQGYVTARRLDELLRGHRPWLVVGGTGRTSLADTDLDCLPAGCHLVSVSSRNVEFDLAGLAERADAVEDLARIGTRYHLPAGPVTVLADGYPVNFHHGESMSNRHSDLTMAALAYAACVLARPDHGFLPGHNLARTNAALAASGLLERYYACYGPDHRPG
jgi:S-adenosylhomocysteine hydrolase